MGADIPLVDSDSRSDGARNARIVGDAWIMARKFTGEKYDASVVVFSPLWVVKVGFSVCVCYFPFFNFYASLKNKSPLLFVMHASVTNKTNPLCCLSCTQA